MQQRQYKTAKDMQKKLNLYQTILDNSEFNNGIPTISGLIKHLGLTRPGFQYYKNLAEFKDIIDMALVDISDRIEAGMLEGKYGAAASIFYLKAAFQWRENITLTTAAATEVKI